MESYPFWKKQPIIFVKFAKTNPKEINERANTHKNTRKCWCKINVVDSQKWNTIRYTAISCNAESYTQLNVHEVRSICAVRATAFTSFHLLKFMYGHGKREMNSFDVLVWNVAERPRENVAIFSNCDKNTKPTHTQDQSFRMLITSNSKKYFIVDGLGCMLVP